MNSKKIVEFRKEVSNFQKERQKVSMNLIKKKKEFEEFFKKITPIIEIM